MNLPAGKRCSVSRSRSSADSMWQPCRFISSASRLAIAAWAITADSLVQRIELSKAFESAIALAALATSAVSST